jgi:hypothetical protein
VLTARGQDVARRHGEARAAAAGRTQLVRPGQLSAGRGVGPVETAAGGLVDGLAGRAVGEAEAVDAADGRGDTAGQTHLRVVVGGARAAAVAEGQQDQLAERVPVDVPLDADAGEGVDVADEGLVLGRVAGGDAAVRLGAGARGGAAGDGPLVGPVAVDVGADAAGAGADLAVLAPETVVGGGVDEAWEMSVGAVTRKGGDDVPSGLTMGMM